MSTVRLQRIDDLTRSDHVHLNPCDTVYYLREYTSGKDYSFGETNSLISNLKKPMSLQGTNQWYYKRQAIERVAQELVQSARIEDMTVVPVPPSKAKSDPLYDDRLVQILEKAYPQADRREIVFQRTSFTASHQSTSRPTPDVLVANYAVDQSLGAPQHEVLIFDDILTTGAHFRAVQRVITDEYPDTVCVGLFIARRVFPPDEGNDLFARLFQKA